MKNGCQEAQAPDILKQWEALETERQLDLARPETFNPTIRIVTQLDVDRAKEFIESVKLVENNFGVDHSRSIAATEVLKILRLIP